ncbi:MAG: DUF2505 domain-containing protein [Panacagrimonas sp.]
MKHTTTIPFSCPADVVLRGLVASHFHIDKWMGMGAISCELIEEGRRGNAYFVKLRRRVRQTSAPGPLAKLVPTEISFIHRDEWDPTTGKGIVEVETEGLPLRMRATSRVIATARGSEQRFDWEIKASVPLLGGALEKFAARDVDREIVTEARVVDALLAQYA